MITSTTPSLREQLTIAKLAAHDLDVELTAAKITIANQDNHIKALGQQIDQLLGERVTMAAAYARLHNAVMDLINAEGVDAQAAALEALLELVG